MTRAQKAQKACREAAEAIEDALHQIGETPDGEFEDFGAQAIRRWLDRQKLCGLISPDGAATVERLIEDLR